jgi:Fe-S-cluster containining protein
MILAEPTTGYAAGTILRDVSLREARSWECNRCGDCCDGTSEYVKIDDFVGLPLFVWTKANEDTAFELPEDRYAERYGRPLIQPVIRGDGGLCVGEEFERDGRNDEHRSFKCAALEQDGEQTRCSVYDVRPSMRPYHCGSFPVFGLEADAAIIGGGEYIPHTSALPRCTWYGIRIVRDS